VNKRMLAGLPFDDRSERSRSPSPEPVYDQMGVRQNTRDILTKARSCSPRHPTHFRPSYFRPSRNVMS
jgi:hypothetical protein